jgi:hypothetical protein
MPVSTLPADTSLEAARVQIASLQRMTSQQRGAIAQRMNEVLRSEMMAGARRRHPDYTEQQVRWAVAKLTLGPELFAAAYPGVEVEL